MSHAADLPLSTIQQLAMLTCTFGVFPRRQKQGLFQFQTDGVKADYMGFSMSKDGTLLAADLGWMLLQTDRLTSSDSHRFRTVHEFMEWTSQRKWTCNHTAASANDQRKSQIYR